MDFEAQDEEDVEYILEFGNGVFERIFEHWCNHMEKIDEDLTAEVFGIYEELEELFLDWLTEVVYLIQRYAEMQ